MQFSYDASRPVGDRIVSLKIKGQPVAADKKYSLVTTNFIAFDGGDGYTMFKGVRILNTPRTILDSDALRQAMTVARPIAPKVEGRIERLDKTMKTRSECD
jgi:5'-nucleotidase